MEKMKKGSKKKFMAAALAGLVVAAGTFAVQGVAQAGDAQCYGVNKCKGTGDCGGKGSACAGTNSCKGKGWLSMSKETCLKINGGTLSSQS